MLIGAYTGALGIVLLLSAAVQTEEAAVAALPLLIMPQLLISPIGVGRAEEILFTSHATLPFHPLGVSFCTPMAHRYQRSSRFLVAELPFPACALAHQGTGDLNRHSPDGFWLDAAARCR